MKSLSRKDNHRKSLVRNLATSLILYEEIETTSAKAKAVKPVVEHLINFAKKNIAKNPLIARRRLLSELFDEKAVKKTIEVLVPRYKKIDSGFIKSIKNRKRVGDSAEMTILILTKVKEGKDEEKANREDKSNSKTKK